MTEELQKKSVTFSVVKGVLIGAAVTAALLTGAGTVWHLTEKAGGAIHLSEGAAETLGTKLKDNWKTIAVAAGLYGTADGTVRGIRTSSRNRAALQQAQSYVDQEAQRNGQPEQGNGRS